MRERGERGEKQDRLNEVRKKHVYLLRKIQGQVTQPSHEPPLTLQPVLQPCWSHTHTPTHPTHTGTLLTLQPVLQPCQLQLW